MQSSTGSTSALQQVDELEGFVTDLRRELKGYGDTNTVGRDTQKLTQYFDRIHQCELQIAQSMGINWSPGTWSPNSS